MVLGSKLSLFAAVVQGVLVDEDNSSLLQLQKNRVRPIPLANPWGVCDNSARLVLDPPAVNNLGATSDGHMKFANVLRNEGVEGIDLIIENTTVYEPSNANANTLNGEFVQVNMWCGQTHSFKMKLVNSDGALHPVEEFVVSVYDVDEGVLPDGEPQGRETVRVCGVSPEVSQPNTLSVEYGDDGCVEVTSTTFGNVADNPSTTIMNDLQAGRTVDFPFHNSAEATMTFSITPCKRGRNLLFAFEPSVSCYVSERSTTTSSTTTTPAPTTTEAATTQAVPSGVCYIQGDPHIKVFDHPHRDVSIYDSGDFWVIRSEQVQVQGRYWATNPSGQSSMKSLAIGGPFLDNRILIIDGPSKRFTYHGNQILQQVGDSFAEAGWSAERRIESAKAKAYLADSVILNLPLDINVVVNIMENGHIDSWIEAKPLAGGQDGHCGNFNGNGADDTRDAINARNQVVDSADTLFNDRGFQFAGCFKKDNSFAKTPGSDYTVNECAAACANYAYFSRRTYGKCWCGDSHAQGNSDRADECALCLTSANDFDMRQDNGRRNDCLYQYDDTVVAAEVSLDDCPDRAAADAECGGIEDADELYDCVFDACFE